MFDIQPSRKITIHAIDLHVVDVGMVDVEIWTKPGSYAGAENDRTAWSKHLEATVSGGGLGKGTSLDTGELQMEAEEMHSLYITVSGQGLRYTNGIGSGNIAASNRDMILYEGIGKKTPFGHTFKDRIWNGILYYTVEDYPFDTVMPTSPPTEPLLSSARKLETTYSGTTGQSGIMFDVLAYADISITGFDINMGDNGVVQVDVLTKEGTLAGHERNCSAWSVIASIIVSGEGFGNSTYLNLEMVSVPVRKDTVQAFYITQRSGSGIRYSVGEHTGSLFVRDDSLAIFAGVGKSYPCGLTFQNRVWNGGVHYEVINGWLSPGQPNRGYDELEVTFFGNEFLTGTLFSLHSKKVLSLVGLGVYIDSTEVVKIELYSASSEDKVAIFGSHLEMWTTVVSVDIVGAGGGRLTSVPPEAFSPVMIRDAETLAFFVKVTIDGNNPEMIGLVVPTSNTDLTISNVEQSECEIFSSGKIQEWRVVFKYLIVDM